MIPLLPVYQAICALVSVLVATVMIRSRRLAIQAMGAAVLVPLLLRLFLVK